MTWYIVIEIQSSSPSNEIQLFSGRFRRTGCRSERAEHRVSPCLLLNHQQWLLRQNQGSWFSSTAAPSSEKNMASDRWEVRCRYEPMMSLSQSLHQNIVVLGGGGRWPSRFLTTINSVLLTVSAAPASEVAADVIIKDSLTSSFSCSSTFYPLDGLLKR